MPALLWYVGNLRDTPAPAGVSRLSRASYAAGVTVRLDHSARWLIELLGEEAAFRLVERRGGTRIFVPKELNLGHPLAREIGLGAALKLCGEFPSMWVKIPLCRDWRVQVYRARGMTYREIALRLVMTESGVSRVLTMTGATDPTKARRATTPNAAPAASAWS